MADEWLEPYSWETDFEWRSRKNFIRTWQSEYPADRLASLAMCWANMKFFGCRYPAEVESLIHEMESKCPDVAEPKKRPPKKSKNSVIENFTLYEPSDADSNLNAISVLCESAQKSKKSITYEESLSKTGFTCAVIIQDKLIATGEALGKKDAKRAAAEKTLEVLRTCQPVVKKRKIDHDAQAVNKTELTKKAYQEAAVIPESNLGNQLLRKMGWTGSGGIGKKGQGRAEPVMVTGVDGFERCSQTTGNSSKSEPSEPQSRYTFSMEIIQRKFKLLEAVEHLRLNIMDEIERLKSQAAGNEPILNPSVLHESQLPNHQYFEDLEPVYQANPQNYLYQCQQNGGQFQGITSPSANPVNEFPQAQAEFEFPQPQAEFIVTPPVSSTLHGVPAGSQPIPVISTRGRHLSLNNMTYGSSIGIETYWQAGRNVSGTLECGSSLNCLQTASTSKEQCVTPCCRGQRCPADVIQGLDQASFDQPDARPQKRSRTRSGKSFRGNIDFVQGKRRRTKAKSKTGPVSASLPPAGGPTSEGQDVIPDSDVILASMAVTIPEENMGYQLLRRMGWTGYGTGLGKHEQGLAEPIANTGVAKRKRGLGADLAGDELKTRARNKRTRKGNQKENTETAEQAKNTPGASSKQGENKAQNTPGTSSKQGKDNNKQAKNTPGASSKQGKKKAQNTPGASSKQGENKNKQAEKRAGTSAQGNAKQESNNSAAVNCDGKDKPGEKKNRTKKQIQNAKQNKQAMNSATETQEDGNASEVKPDEKNGAGRKGKKKNEQGKQHGVQQQTNGLEGNESTSDFEENKRALKKQKRLRSQERKRAHIQLFRDAVQQLQSTPSPACCVAGLTGAPKKSTNLVIENFTIYEPWDANSNSIAISILCESAQKSRQRIYWPVLQSKAGVTCGVIIQDKVIATGEGPIKRHAKRAAAEKALEVLRKCQPVVKKTRKIKHGAQAAVNKLKSSPGSGSTGLVDLRFKLEVLRSNHDAQATVNKFTSSPVSCDGNGDLRFTRSVLSQCWMEREFGGGGS